MLQSRATANTGKLGNTNKPLLESTKTNVWPCWLGTATGLPRAPGDPAQVRHGCEHSGEPQHVGRGRALGPAGRPGLCLDQGHLLQTAALLCPFSLPGWQQGHNRAPRPGGWASPPPGLPGRPTHAVQPNHRVSASFRFLLDRVPRRADTYLLPPPPPLTASECGVTVLHPGPLHPQALPGALTPTCAHVHGPFQRVSNAKTSHGTVSLPSLPLAPRHFTYWNTATSPMGCRHHTCWFGKVPTSPNRSLSTHLPGWREVASRGTGKVPGTTAGIALRGRACTCARSSRAATGENVCTGRRGKERRKEETRVNTDRRKELSLSQSAAVPQGARMTMEGTECWRKHPQRTEAGCPSPRSG